MSFIGVDLAIPTDTDMNRNPRPRSMKQLVTATDKRADPPDFHQLPISRNDHKSKKKKDRGTVSPNEIFSEYKQDPVYYSLGEEAEIDHMAAFVPLEHETTVGRLEENDCVFVRRSGGRFCFALIKSLEPNDEDGLIMHLYVSEAGATKSIPRSEWINYIRPAKQFVHCNPSSHVSDLMKDPQGIMKTEESQQLQRSRSRSNRRASCPEAAQDVSYIQNDTNERVKIGANEAKSKNRSHSRGNRRTSCPETAHDAKQIQHHTSEHLELEANERKQISRSRSRDNRHSSCPEAAQNIDYAQNCTSEGVMIEATEVKSKHRSRSRGNRRSSCPEAAHDEYSKTKAIESKKSRRRSSRVGRVKSDEPKKNSLEYEMVKKLWMRQSTSQLEMHDSNYPGNNLSRYKSISTTASDENDSVVPYRRPSPDIATDTHPSGGRQKPLDDCLDRDLKPISFDDTYAPKNTAGNISENDKPNERQFSENTKDTAYSSLKTNPTTGHMSSYDVHNERQFSENTRDTAFSSLQSNMTPGYNMNGYDAPNERQYSENTRDTEFSSLKPNMATEKKGGIDVPNKRQFSENTKSTAYSSFKTGTTATNPASETQKSNVKSNKQIIHDAIAFATSMQTNLSNDEESRHVKWDIASQGQSVDDFPMPDNTVPQFRPLIHRVKTEHESDRRSELAKQKHLRRSTATDIGNDYEPSKGKSSRRSHSRRSTVGGLSESQKFDQSLLLSAFSAIQPKKG